MMRRLLIAALCCTALAGAGALDENARRQAERYQALLLEKPDHAVAFERLWKIHGDAGETEAWLDLLKQQSGTSDRTAILYGRALQRAGKTEDAQKVLLAVWERDQGNFFVASLLADLLAQGDKTKVADLWEKTSAAAPQNPEVFLRLGAAWQNAGDDSKSRAAWEKAVALAPQDLALRKKLAGLARDAGETEIAATHLRVLAAQGLPAQRLAAWEEIVQLYEKAGDMQQAITAQEAALALLNTGHWQLPAARKKLLALHLREGSLDTLEIRWKAEAEQSPANPDFASRLADLYAFQGNDAAQREWLQKAVALQPNEAGLIITLAELEFTAGNLSASGELYDRAIILRPGDADAIFHRAEIDVLTRHEADAEKRIAGLLAARKDDESINLQALDFYRRMRLSVPLEKKLVADFAARPGDEAAAFELARFYLDEKRFDKIAETFSRFDSSRLSASDAAAAFFRMAGFLREARLPVEAEAWAHRSFEKDPANAEVALMLAEMLAASDRPDEIRAVLEKACTAEGVTLPREDLDRRLFLVLQSPKNGKVSGLLLPPQQKDIQEMVGVLRQRAEDGKEENLLRLARWLRWSNDVPGAVEALGRGLAVEKNSTLREALASLLAESGRTVEAIKLWETIALFAPERQVEIQRRIGHLELDRGNIEEGVRQFRVLAQEHPQDWQALSDLAQAEQISGQWFKALETWQQASRLAPPDARVGLRQPILNAAVRLQLFDRAFDYLESTAAAERDEKMRADILREAAVFAVQNQSVDRWQARLDAAISKEPGNASWKKGLVSLLEAQGRGEEARKLLIQLNQEKGTDPENLERLLQAAEEANDWNEAARLARLATTQTPGNFEAWRHYAELLENAGQNEEAARVWEGMIVRFSRANEALLAAAAFFERNGREDRMVACLRAAAELGAPSPQTLLRLGELAMAGGDKLQALEDFQMLLAQTRPTPEQYENCLPLPDWMAAAQRALPSSESRKPDRADVEGCRLLAIGKSAQMLQGSPEKSQWLQQWKEPDAFFNEYLWALYFSGERNAVLEEMQRRISSRDVSPPFVQGFALLALESGEGARLSVWAASGDNAKYWDDILAALTRLTDAGWTVDVAVLRAAFDRAPLYKRWQACTILAGKRKVEEALVLSEGMPAQFPAMQATAAWLRIAEWRLMIFDTEGAIKALDEAIPLDSFTLDYRQPIFAALRMRWLLTPAYERGEFEKTVQGQPNVSTDPDVRMAVKAFFAALRNDREEMQAAINEIVEKLGSDEFSDVSTAAQQMGEHLEGWQLDNLARAIYRAALGRDAALVELQGETQAERTMITRLVASKLAAARWEKPEYLIHQWVGWGATNDEMAFAALQLQKMGRPDTAAVLNRMLCERAPKNETAFASLSRLAQSPSQREFAADLFQRLLDNPAAYSNQPFAQNMGQRLAGQLEEDGDYGRARILLETLQRKKATNRTLSLQHARLLIRLGRHREAMKELEENVGVLTGSPGYDVQLAELYSAFGREEEAQALLEKQKTAVFPSGGIKISLPPQLKEEKDWIRYLGKVNGAALSPIDRYRVGEEIVLLTPPAPEKIWRAEMIRLEKLARENPALQARHFTLRKQVAQREGTVNELEKALREEWNHGRGNYFAGEILIQLGLESRRFENFDALLEEYLSHSDYQPVARQEIAARLLGVGQPALSARIYERVIRQSPGDAALAVKYAEALWKSGRRSEAMKIIEPIARTAVLDPQKHLDVAGFFLQVQRIGLAEPHLREATALLSRDGRAASVWVTAAKEYLTQKDFVRAREAMEQAAAVPRVLPVEVIADYYQQSGQGEELKEKGDGLPLSPRERSLLAVVMADRLVGAGEEMRAWEWLEKGVQILWFPQGRQALQKLETSDWARAAKMWEQALNEDTLWEVRTAAAEFYLRRAQASDPAGRLKPLQRAHELHPGSFAIARACAEEFRRRGRTQDASKVLQDVLNAYASPADRRAAREMLASLKASPVLPPQT